METGVAGSFSYETGGTTLCGDPDDVDGGSRSTKSIHGSILSGGSHEDGAHSLLRRAPESFGSWFDTPWDVGFKRVLVKVPTMVDDGRVDLVRVEARIRNLVRELRGPETQTRKISGTKAETVTTVPTAWRATRTAIQQHKLQRVWLASSKAGPRGIFPQQHPAPCLRNYSIQKNAQAEVSDLGEPSAVATDGLIWQQGAPLPKPHETSSITDRYSIFLNRLEVYPREEEPAMVEARLSPAILGSSLDLDSLQQQYVLAAFTRAARESIERRVIPSGRDTDPVITGCIYSLPPASRLTFQHYWRIHAMEGRGWRTRCTALCPRWPYNGEFEATGVAAGVFCIKSVFLPCRICV
jgi:hypothetical protein